MPPLTSSDHTDNHGLHIDECVGVNFQGLEGGETEDVRLGPRVFNSLGDDLGGSCSPADFGFAVCMYMSS